ncbi:hypothetical protein ILUMI_02478, partial [Ignelater luminosus]
SMLDMRNALTIEVAEKHDIILNLRRDVQQLEEQCRQSNKQTQFKDDIIKELRKQIKLLNGQVRANERSKSLSSPPPIIHAVLTVPENSLHQCCPYVKDLCPLSIKNNISHISPLTKLTDNSELSLNNDKSHKTEINAAKQDNQALIFLNDEIPTRDCLIKEKPTVSFMSRSQKDANDKKLQACTNSPCVILPKPHQSSDKRQQFKSKLTATRILHEYYSSNKQGIGGSVETFNEPSKKNVDIPGHVPVKTFVTNLERNS